MPRTASPKITFTMKEVLRNQQLIGKRFIAMPLACRLTLYQDLLWAPDKTLWTPPLS
jgi:hypothetical protein